MMVRRQHHILLITVITWATLAAACSTLSETIEQPTDNSALSGAATSTTITKASVTRVVDGDTIIVEQISGYQLPADRIRLIGVDTPEVHGRAEPYGAEASAFAKSRLQGATVWLEKDVSETDRYKRALRYVWLSEPPASPTSADIRRLMFNAVLLEEGYAQVATFPPDVKYTELFLTLQREAREERRGLWSLTTEQPSSGDLSTDNRAPQILHLDSPVDRGSNVTLTITADPGAQCSLTVRLKSGPSRAKGTESQKADEQGRVSWSWKVAPSTTPGTWPLIIECDNMVNVSELEIR